MTTLKKSLAAFVLIASGGFASTAQADTFNFSCITNNDAQDCQVGLLQLSVEVLAAPAGQVQFIFRNAGPAASSITDIYFDDGTLLGLASITNGSGVDFSQDASPGNLPGGTSISPAFEATTGFTADSNAPTQPSGVNPGEVVSIFFTLQAGGTLADVISELYSGELRIGVHVQGFLPDGSESFVNTVPTVPLPAAVWLLLGGLGGFGALRRR
jgi:hypothetical protein